MDIFDGIFQGDDEGFPVLVYLVYHSGQCSRSAASGRSCHQNQAALPLCQSDDGFRHPQTLWRRQLRIHQVQRKCHTAFLLISVCTASSAPGNRERKIVFPLLLKCGPLCLGHDMNQEIQRIRRIQPGIIHGNQPAVYTHLRHNPCRQMHVAGAGFPGRTQDFFY